MNNKDVWGGGEGVYVHSLEGSTREKTSSPKMAHVDSYWWEASLTCHWASPSGLLECPQNMLSNFS
jgi:hypothetical protein